LKDKHIDIIVPTYNRPDDIRRFVKEIQKQTYIHYRVLIIDDCGEENIKKFIPNHNEHFVYTRLSENKGQAYARNYAVSMSTADIIIFMDDDAWFMQDNALENIVHYFANNPDMAALMFDVKEPERAYLSERHNLKELQEIGEFIACGCAFRAIDFKNTNGFREEFHSYGEETELSMQLIKNERKLYFSREIGLFHNYVPGQRSKNWFKRFKFNSVRNDLLIVLNRYPALYVVPFFIGKVLSHFVYNLFHEKYFWLSSVQVFKAVPNSLVLFNRNKREALSIKQFNYWRKVRF